MFKKLLGCITILFAVNANAYNWNVTKVIDGDTFITDAKFFPTELGNIHVRVLGIDTPESTYLAKCDKEKQLGLKAKARTKELIEHQYVVVTNVAADKYGKRVVGNVSYLKQGSQISLSNQLISEGLAVPYNGGTKTSWCK